MDKLIEFATSQAGLSLLGWGVGLVWAALKSSEWFRGRVSARFRKATECLEAGVEQTYQIYVREIKRGRADGKLTNTERARARASAIDAARRFAKRRGINLVKELGEDLVTFHVERAVRRAKREAAQPISLAEAARRLGLSPENKPEPSSRPT